MYFSCICSIFLGDYSLIRGMLLFVLQTQPFTNIQPEAHFSMARFIYLQLSVDTPPKVSKAYPILLHVSHTIHVTVN